MVSERMLKETDEEWLRESHPALIRTGGVIAGEIRFRASYNAQTNIFRIVSEDAWEESGTITLAGVFQIRIEERRDESISRLPALHIEGMEPIPDRHFNQQDKSACLCSPFDEDAFLQPELQFRLFLERLIIPFLYGQVFYSSHGRWPWAEYAHGGTGILEAYCRFRDANRAEQCLARLKQDRKWPSIQSALRQTPHIKGHTLCFCEQMDQIRRCHPIALQGALLLQQDLRKRAIPV